MSNATEVRQLAIGVLIAAADDRLEDVAVLLADADPMALAVAAGGLALAVGAVLAELPEERRAVLREQFGMLALGAAVREG